MGGIRLEHKTGIENEVVSKIYDRCEKIFDDTTVSDKTRIKYYEKMYLIQIIATIYESDEYDDEEIDDIFIRYGEGGIKPAFKEDLRNIFADELKEWKK